MLEITGWLAIWVFIGFMWFSHRAKISSLELKVSRLESELRELDSDLAILDFDKDTIFKAEV